MSCPACLRTSMALNRLKAKHARFAAETNKMLIEQLREIDALRTRLARYEERA
ncbi:hypothetical protein [Nocardioides sp. Iso805N]|uniref:hypothetical protein n=1 Tax=Nocardioides sp. Iso805N TaxID=1283287 RepID=UPI00037C4A82|nr:hypothetical protein [Nocardioides sp. Iso805N]